MKLHNEKLKYIFHAEKPSVKRCLISALLSLAALVIFVTGPAGEFSFLTLMIASTSPVLICGFLAGNIFEIITVIFTFIFSYTDIFSSIRYDYEDVFLLYIPVFNIAFWLMSDNIFYTFQKYKYRRNNYRNELKQRIDEGNQKLSEMSFNFMDTLYNAYTAKHPEEKAHAERVAALSQSIALNLMNDMEFAYLCYKAGLLHDIGKIKFSDDFYGKTEYTDEEYELYKTHVDFGSELLSNFQFDEISLAVKYHHEKYDGSGYPEGLKGKDIPLIAQIVGLADETDSLNQKYSKPEVLKILKCKGSTEYAPALVEAAMEIII